VIDGVHLNDTALILQGSAIPADEARALFLNH